MNNLSPCSGTPIRLNIAASGILRAIYKFSKKKKMRQLRGISLRNI